MNRRNSRWQGSDLEAVLRANLKLRSDLAVEVAKAVEPAAFGHKILNMEKGVFDWWRNRFGRSKDQHFALLLVFIAITLYVFI
jgi:hypothetical protein